MTKKYRHITKGFEIKVDTRHGKPVVSKYGFIDINMLYKGCNKVKEEIFKEVFKEVS